MRRSNDFMRVASLPRGAASDLGLGSGCALSPYSCVFGTDAEAATTVVVDVAAAADCDAIVDDQELGDEMLAIVLSC